MAVTDLTGATVHPDAAGDVLNLGTSPTVQGDVVNPGDVLIVQNVGATSVDIMATAYYAVEGISLADGGGTVPANGVGVFKFGGAFAQPADGAHPGKVLVTYSSPADVHRAVV